MCLPQLAKPLVPLPSLLTCPWSPGELVETREQAGCSCRNGESLVTARRGSKLQGRVVEYVGTTRPGGGCELLAARESTAKQNLQWKVSDLSALVGGPSGVTPPLSQLIRGWSAANPRCQPTAIWLAATSWLPISCSWGGKPYAQSKTNYCSRSSQGLWKTLWQDNLEVFALDSILWCSQLHFGR